MNIPHLSRATPPLADRRFDERDPRALDVFAPWDDDESPALGLVGVPFDGAVVGRKGAAEGPAGIREALRYSSSYHWETNTELYGTETGDVGDVEVTEHVGATHERVHGVVAKLLGAGTHPIVLGGDNSITYATVAGLLEAVDGHVGIVDLDAHLDVRVSEPAVNSGTPFRRILQDFGDRVRAENVAQIGHRQFANSRHYRQWAADQGVRVFDMGRVNETGMDAVLDEAVAAAGDGTDHLVLSVDMDAVDQTHAPGVSAPTPSGLLPVDLFAAVRRLASEDRTRFMEIVEVAPPLDPTGNTARLAAVAVMEYATARTAEGGQ